MVPAADFAHDVKLYEKTFTMANISPQVKIYLFPDQVISEDRGWFIIFKGSFAESGILVKI